MGMENKQNEPGKRERSEEGESDLQPELLFGNNLKFAREKLNKSASSMASALGIGVHSVEDWEGTRDVITYPKDDRLPKIAELYNIELSTLKNDLAFSKKGRDKKKSSRVSITQGGPKIKK